MATALAAVALLAACGGGGSKAGKADDGSLSPSDYAALLEAADHAKPCSEVAKPGRPTADVVKDLDANDGMCKLRNGDLTGGYASWDCPDGTTVYDVGDKLGWGRTGGTWQAAATPRPYADCVMPGADAQHP